MKLTAVLSALFTVALVVMIAAPVLSVVTAENSQPRCEDIALAQQCYQQCLSNCGLQICDWGIKPCSFNPNLPCCYCRCCV